MAGLLPPRHEPIMGSSATGIGCPVKRVEDTRFLKGRGHFIPNLDHSGALWVAFVRSTHAHARIVRTDAKAALALSSTVAVLFGDDMAADGVGPIVPIWTVKGADGKPMAEPVRWAIARGVVRHVGEPIALVVANSRRAAAQAAELVEITYEELPVVTESEEAIRPGAPLVHVGVPGNVCVRVERGDKAAVDQALDQAEHVVTLHLVNNRLAGAAMEPRSLIASWNDEAQQLTLWSGTQSPHNIRKQVAVELGLAESAVRVISPDIGGGFGYKGKHYCEETALAWAARRLGRPVRWTATRSESFLADLQSRDHTTTAELAIDGNGKFLGLRVKTLANIGAYVSSFGAAVPTGPYTSLLSGVYAIPAIHAEVQCVFTNTIPTDAYRGAGRPEACYVLERLVDKAARMLAIDPAQLRSRNLIPAGAMPYTTAVGVTYDCGNFQKILDRATEKAGYANFSSRAKASAEQGRLRGIGIGMFVESSGVGPSRSAGAGGAHTGFFEGAEIRVDSVGAVIAMIGTHNHGQGHQTTYAQILSEVLGVPFEEIRIVEGDTGIVPYGAGTYGSRSIAVGGSALVGAAGKVIRKGAKVAAHILEGPEDKIAFANGYFELKGSNRSVSFKEVARAANVAHNLPPNLEPGLHETSFFDPPNFAFSNGCHIAEIEIDAETGVVTVVNFVAVDDIGTVINPMIVEGQVHGGIAQGIGQALIESVVYDRADGQLLSGSFMDYGIPRADTLPVFDTETDESQPFPGNPLGAKGCGEAGSIGAPAAIVNAVLNALNKVRVDDIGMPITPEKVWRSMQSASRAAGGENA